MARTQNAPVRLWRWIAQRLMIMSLAGLAVGCVDETFLFVGSHSLSFSEGEGTQQVQVLSNKDFRATSGASWCRVTTKKEDAAPGSFALSVTCEANSSYEERSCNVTVMCEGHTESIEVKQKPTISISFDKAEYIIGEDGGLLVVKVTANLPFQCEVDADASSWIRVLSTSSSSSMEFMVSSNESYDSRTGHILFYDANSSLRRGKLATVVQSRKGALIIDGALERSIDENGGSIEVRVKTNLNYSYSVNTSWIHHVSTKDLSTYVESFSVDKNTSYDDRVGYIRFYDIDNKKEEFVKITQDSKGDIRIETTKYDVGYEYKELTIPVLTNKDYEVRVKDDCSSWINWSKDVGTKGLESKSFTLKIAENEKTVREGEVFVSIPGKSITIKLKQADGTVAIPDEHFRAYCLENFDTNRDGLLSHKEAKRVLSIRVNTEDISSIEGIGSFINLEVLHCGDGVLGDGATGLLKQLDVSNNTALTYLSCEGNQLTSLNLSQNRSLKYLCCRENLLTSLDLSNNSELEELECSDNRLTKLAISKNAALTTLNCGLNQLTSLDVSTFSSLTQLYCADNRLSSLDVSSCKALTRLLCHSNSINHLDVSENRELIYLDCSNNQITLLKTNAELLDMRCNSNQLYSLDLSNNTLLSYLECRENYLHELNISKNTGLKTIWCNDNQLTLLNTGDINIEGIVCRNNQLQNIDVSSNKKLISLDCTENILSSLDISNNLELSWLSCRNNHISSIDISKNEKLSTLWCGYNSLTSLDVSNNTVLKVLHCESNSILELDVSRNTLLWEFGCEGNRLSILDVSNNLMLYYLNCVNNFDLKTLWLAEGQNIVYLHKSDYTEIRYK